MTQDADYVAIVAAALRTDCYGDDLVEPDEDNVQLAEVAVRALIEAGALTDGTGVRDPHILTDSKEKGSE